MTNAEFIETFGGWVTSLPQDVEALQKAATAEGASNDAKRFLVGGLSYLLRKIDIIPDYLPGVGVVDDAMVLRLSAALASEAGLGDLDDDLASGLKALAGDKTTIDDFLGDLADKMSKYVGSLPDDSIRGRDANKIIESDEVRDQFLREIGDEIKNYEPQAFKDEDRALRELKSFIKAKLDKL